MTSGGVGSEDVIPRRISLESARHSFFGGRPDLSQKKFPFGMNRSMCRLVAILHVPDAMGLVMLWTGLILNDAYICHLGESFCMNDACSLGYNEPVCRFWIGFASAAAILVVFPPLLILVVGGTFCTLGRGRHWNLGPRIKRVVLYGAIPLPVWAIALVFVLFMHWFARCCCSRLRPSTAREDGVADIREPQVIEIVMDVVPQKSTA